MRDNYMLSDYLDLGYSIMELAGDQVFPVYSKSSNGLKCQVIFYLIKGNRILGVRCHFQQIRIYKAQIVEFGMSKFERHSIPIPYDGDLGEGVLFDGTQITK